MCLFFVILVLFAVVCFVVGVDDIMVPVVDYFVCVRV